MFYLHVEGSYYFYFHFRDEKVRCNPDHNRYQVGSESGSKVLEMGYLLLNRWKQETEVKNERMQIRSYQAIKRQTIEKLEGIIQK